jgi:hypothetical protein
MFDMVQEGEDHFFIQVFEGKAIHGFFELLSPEAQKELEGISVGDNGVGGDPFGPCQILIEERMHIIGYRM